MSSGNGRKGIGRPILIAVIAAAVIGLGAFAVTRLITVNTPVGALTTAIANTSKAFDFDMQAILAAGSGIAKGEAERVDASLVVVETTDERFGAYAKALGGAAMQLTEMTDYAGKRSTLEVSASWKGLIRTNVASVFASEDKYAVFSQLLNKTTTFTIDPKTFNERRASSELFGALPELDFDAVSDFLFTRGGGESGGKPWYSSASEITISKGERAEITSANGSEVCDVFTVDIDKDKFSSFMSEYPALPKAARNPRITFYINSGKTISRIDFSLETDDGAKYAITADIDSKAKTASIELASGAEKIALDFSSNSAGALLAAAVKFSYTGGLFDGKGISGDASLTWNTAAKRDNFDLFIKGSYDEAVIGISAKGHVELGEDYVTIGDMNVTLNAPEGATTVRYNQKTYVISPDDVIYSLQNEKPLLDADEDDFAALYDAISAFMGGE